MRVIEKSDLPFKIGVGLGALLLAVVIGRMRFCDDIELPAMPARPAAKPISTVEVERAVERSPAFYAQHVSKDAAAFGLERAPTPADMGKPFPYRAEDVAIVLDPSDKKARGEALGLVFTMSLQSLEGSPDRQMILSIQNTTDRYLAYKVTTRPSRGTTPCHKKRDLAHNAVVLAPGVTEQRSECLWNKGWTLRIEKVEVMELPELSYHYASLLPAGTSIGLDPRTSRGHRGPDRDTLCQLFHSAEIDNHLRSGVTSWRDMIDFYGRHRCKTYTFSAGYRAVEPGKEIALPAAPEGR